MTEYEGLALEKVLRKYKSDFGRLVADALAQLPAKLEPEVLPILNTLNVYNAGHQESLPVMRTNYGTKPKAELPDFLSIAPRP